MQHGHRVTSRIVTTLLLALAFGTRVAGAGSIAIQWDPNNEFDVVGYRVFIGTQSGLYTSSVDVGNTTSFLFNNAEPGQKYCFAVAAYSSGPRLGDKSTEVCSDTSGNQPPKLTNPGDQSSALGAALTLTLDGSDPEGLPVTFAAKGLPAGLTLNVNTGFISGTPTAVGTYNTQVTVSDGSLSMTQAFTWTISASAPGASSPLRPSGNISTATPTFEWESVAAATSYRLWVDDASTTDPKIQLDLTPAQAGCTTAGAVCHVSPGVSLQAGHGSWSVRASNASGDGPWSGAMDFTVVDSKLPTISILAPTSEATFTTSAATVTIAGTAADDGGIALVTWTNNLGGSGNAVGTSTWSVLGIPLKVGTNLITLTARDAAGNVATDVLSVTKTGVEAPSVSILLPTTAASYTTSNAMVVVSGSAAADAGVTQVTWVNDRGGSGAAAGTTAWSTGGVALKAGANVITVTASDAAGHKTTKSITVSMTDGEPPVVSITSPAGANYTTGKDSIALSGTAADAVGVTQVSWVSDRGPSGAASGTTAWSVPAIALKEGVNVITVTARDAAGNSGSAHITVTTTDQTAPVVKISEPAATGTYSTASASIALAGSASDASGVARVTWSSDKGAAGAATGTTAWSANVPLEIGANVITVSATDATGNVATAAITVTRTDGVAPTIAITTPVSGTSMSTADAAFALGGTASDNIGVTQVTWATDKGASGVASGTTTWTIAGVKLQFGANVITVTAKDAAGNVASDVLTVTLKDTRAPVVAIVSPVNTSTYATTENEIALSGTASDDGELAEVSWSNSQGGSGTATGTTAWTAQRIPLKVGLNTLKVTARDAAGNVSSATLGVRVTDTKAPSVRITAPSSDKAASIGQGIVNVEGTASDNFGVASVTWVNDRGGSGAAVLKDTRWVAGRVVLQPGLNVIKVTAADASGNVVSDVLRLTYETGVPTISLTSPTTASTYTTTSPNVALAGVASDDSGIARVKWSTDKGQIGEAIGTTSWTIPAVTVPLGTTIVTVTAYDGSGNTASLTLNIVYADTAKPTVKIYTPTTSASVTTAASSVTVAGTATDNVGVTQVTWATDRGAGGTAFGTASWSTPAIALASGTTVVTVTAKDAAGNVGVAVLTVTSTSTTQSAPTASQSAEPTGSTPPAATTATTEAPTTAEKAPRVRVMTPTSNARFSTTGDWITVAGVASHDSGIAVVRWSTDRGDAGVASGTANWKAAKIPVRPGTTIITITATSVAGSTGSDVLTVVRPDPLPKLSLTYPTADSQWTSGTATVSLKGTATANVTRVTWSSDSGASGVATGTAKWAITGLRLQQGVNRITLTAEDASGRTDRQVLKITYSPLTTEALRK